MNTNTNKLKTTLTALSLITASVFTVSAAHAATQNEVQFTAVDPEGLPLSILKDSMTTSTVQGMCATWKKLAETAALTL